MMGQRGCALWLAGEGPPTMELDGVGQVRPSGYVAS